MSSILKVDTIQDQAGNNIINESNNVITIGASGDTITVPAGATVSGFTSAGIDDNATSVAITINSSEQVGIGTTSPDHLLHISASSSNAQLKLQRTGSATASFNISASSDALAFSDQAAGSERMRLTSTGLGIGTSSPTHNLTVDGGTNTSISLIKDETGSATVRYYNGGSQKSYIQLTASEDMDFFAASGVDQVFYGNGAEVMRLSSGAVFNEGSGDRDFRVESNGNAHMLFVDGGNDRVGIGTSSPSTTLDVAGDATITKNDTPLYLNRTGSDGEIARFSKDGTTQGQIATLSGKMYIGTGNANFRFRDDLTAIIPSNANGTNSDNDLDLGSSGVRWRRLYLSEGVFLGGTGTANKLSDYEEGTWSPALTSDGGGGNSGVTFGDRFGSYTKIGNVVTVHVFVNLDAVNSFGTGNSIIATLPFTSSSTSQYRSAVSIGYAANWDEAPDGGTITNNSNLIYLRKRGSTSALSNLVNIVSIGNMNANSEIILTATYQTDA